MNKQITRKVKFFGAWQDEKEEAWLQEMAQQGLHLKAVGFLTYGFEQGTPQRMAYRLDYTSLRKSDRDSYFQLFSDAGWEWAGEMSGWQYFRKLVEEGQMAEIYTDKRSKVQKYERVLTLLVVLMPMPAYLIVLHGVEKDNLFMDILAGFMFLVLLIYIYAIVKLIKRIRDLKADS